VLEGLDQLLGGEVVDDVAAVVDLDESNAQLPLLAGADQVTDEAAAGGAADDLHLAQLQEATERLPDDAREDLAGPEVIHGRSLPSAPRSFLAVRRVAAARKAIDDAGTGFLLTARTEGIFIGRLDFKSALQRLDAYAEAGADCLYAPRLSDLGQIEALVDTVASLPVNVLLGSDFATVDALAREGVRRISVGGTLARVEWTRFRPGSADDTVRAAAGQAMLHATTLGQELLTRLTAPRTRVPKRPVRLRLSKNIPRRGI
jgi:hypothetical protein